MEKFEKILSLFIKNPYSNIELSEEYKKKKSKFILAVLIVSLVSVFFNGSSMLTIHKSIESNNQLYIIIYLYKFILLFTLIMNLYLIINLYRFIYRQTNFLLFSVYILFSYFNLIFVFILSLLFIIGNIQSITVYSYYLTFLFLVVFYSYYYYNKWKKFILNNHFTRIKKRLQNNKYFIDSDEHFFKFDLKEDEKNKPKLTKIAEKVVSFMMRFGFTLPVLATLASSGTGGNGMIYFAIYLMFFIIPEIMKLITKQSALYSIFKQIEKEEGVTIYNGRLKIDNNEKNKI